MVYIMVSETIELEYYDRLNNISSKLKDATLQAYISLNGIFTGLARFSGRDISNMYKSLVRETNRCYFHRISLRRDSDWDEVLIILCGRTIIASYGFIENKEISGKELLEKVVDNIDNKKYTHCVLETMEIPMKLVEEKLGVDTKSLLIEEKVSEEKRIEEKPSLKTGEKPVEIERIVEEVSAPETLATIPIETSVSRTETIPEEKVSEGERFETSLVEKQITETYVRKPTVLEEITHLDKPVLEFSDKLVGLADRESIGLSNIAVYGDQDRLDVEVVVSKIGWSKKREKMLNLAESIANILSNILLKHNAPQRELIITIRHGLNAIRVFKRIK